MHVFLETARLTLRRFTLQDAHLLVDLDNDPEVMRWLNGGIPTPRDTIEREILPRFLACYDRYDGLGYWAAVDRTTGEFLGWFALHPNHDHPPGEAEVGYRLRRSAWGQGLATEGLRALIRKGFEDHHLTRIYGTTYEENLASRRVMEKSGMILTRRFRLTSADLAVSVTSTHPTTEPWPGDELEYAITREEWTDQHSPK